LSTDTRLAAPQGGSPHGLSYAGRQRPASTRRPGRPGLPRGPARRPAHRPRPAPRHPDWFLAALIFVALLCRKKTQSAQDRFLCARRAALAAWLGRDRFPARSTYCDRYRRAHRLFHEAIRLQGRRAGGDGLADPEVVAVDKSLLDGLGPPWHKGQRAQGQVPAGVDPDTTWGDSAPHGWVQGYSYEVVLTATAGGAAWPLLASGDTASASECATFGSEIGLLPDGTAYVTADSASDADDVRKAVAERPDGRRTGRRFVCPEPPRNGTGQQPGPAPRRRARRRQFLAGRRGRTISRRRARTVAPFHEWLARAFARGGVWHRRLDNNRTQVLAAIFASQVLPRYNHGRGDSSGQVKAILDRL
jgi:hypothetical protein